MSEILPKSAGVDDLQAAYAEVAREPYVFMWADREWSLPHLGALDYRLQAEIESLQTLDTKQLEELFARIFGPVQAPLWAEVEVPTPVLFMLFDRWVEHSGRKSGESRASKRSSKNTGARSRPTSAASTRGSASAKPSTAKPRARKAVSPPASS